MTHPLYARPLVNRNPAQTNRNYSGAATVGLVDAAGAHGGPAVTRDRRRYQNVEST